MELNIINTRVPINVVFPHRDDDVIGRARGQVGGDRDGSVVGVGAQGDRTGLATGSKVAGKKGGFRQAIVAQDRVLAGGSAGLNGVEGADHDARDDGLVIISGFGIGPRKRNGLSR